MEVNLTPDFFDRTLAAFGQLFGAFSTSQHLLFLLLAAVPAAVWLTVFLRRNPESRTRTAVTFLAGMLAIIPIYIFRHEIVRVDGWITAAGLAGVLVPILSSMWVGLYEETAKHWVVKKVDDNAFQSIDDAIEFSIVAALGFSFIENAFYFYAVWSDPASAGTFWFNFVFRSLGSMFLHIFASGIFGYYYGLAHFASPVLQDELAAGRRFFFTKKLHQILHLKSETLFHEEKMLEGLVLAAVLHGTFDALMSLSDYFSRSGSLLAGKLFLVAAVPFLVGGYFWLTYLLEKKEDHKLYGRLTSERTSVTAVADGQ